MADKKSLITRTAILVRLGGQYFVWWQLATVGHVRPPRRLPQSPGSTVPSYSVFPLSLYQIPPS